MQIATRVEEAIIPEIYCPFLSRISPHYEAVKAHTYAWAKHMDLTPHESATQYYRSADYTGLACRTYPWAGFEELCTISDWLFLIFVFDDPYDEITEKHLPHELFALCDHVIAVLNDPDQVVPRGPITHAFADLAKRARASLSPTWLKRFARHHAEYFARVQELMPYRKQRSVPDLQMYLANRPFSAGAIPPFDLIELAQRAEIPAHLYASQALQDIILAGARLIGWTNDLYSVNKDVACGDVANLVLILQHEHRCSLQEAVHRIVAMIEEETRRLQELLWKVPGDTVEVDRYAGSLWVGVATWLRGHLDWYQGNTRYSAQASLEEVNGHLVDILATAAYPALDGKSGC